VEPGKNSSAHLIAPCGMNCALCASYIALTNDLKNKGVKMLYCTGCRARNKQCAFLKKSCFRLRKGEVNFCFECPIFPCEQLKTLDARYKSRYRMSMIDKRTWKCPSCGDLISCHNGLCFNCELEKLRSKKQKYRWNE
jgi:hypothetical protein